MDKSVIDIRSIYVDNGPYMSRDIPFVKYIHSYKERSEVPMHTHQNGQLNFMDEGIIRLRSPSAAWVVPQKRIIWIPPGQLHSVRGENVSGSWKVMIPGKFAKLLPKEISVLQSTRLLLAALESFPEKGEVIAPSRLKLLIEIVKIELASAQREEFGIILPQSKSLQFVANALLKNPEDNRKIDDWAKEIGMSRRTFTRRFASETGDSFAKWRKNNLLNRALVLLSEGKSVSDVADKLGYAYPSAFIVAFKKRFGISAGKFAKT